MASTTKQMNGNATNNNGSLGKRKKSRGNKGSYLSKWLDKTIHHVQDSTPSIETYDSFLNSNWPMNGVQMPPAYDPRLMYGYNEPTSLPTLPTYYSPMLPPMYPPEYRYIPTVNRSIQVQRARRRRTENRAEEVQNTPTGTPNGTLGSNYLQPKTFTDSQDYASLPPIVTSVGDTTSNSDMNANEKEEVGNARRFSDPCVRGLPDVARPGNGEVETDSEGSSSMSGSRVGSRLLTCLLDQINALKIENERLNRDLHETKAELNNYRQHSNIWQKGSPSGNNLQSPLGNGVIPGQYSPGFLTDMVREIRDAARMREDALYSKVRAMVVERSDNGLSAENKYAAEKTMENIKSSLRASEADKCLMMERIAKLEDELRHMKLSNGNATNGLNYIENGLNNNSSDGGDTEVMRLRKELVDLKKAKQNAEDHALKLERLVTQLRSKFNGLQLSPNGPDSLPSESEHDRIRRTSLNSSTGNTTVVFGPVTDL